MFRRSRDDILDRLVLVENVVGVNLPRIASLEFRIKDNLVPRIEAIEAYMQRDVQRKRLLQEAAEEGAPPITAALADGAPQYTEGTTLPPEPAPPPGASTDLPEEVATQQ